MDKQLYHRPNFDHLRRQAKSLLAELAAGNTEAIATFQEYLPAAKNMNPEQTRMAGFRLADAQSAIARKTGFLSWPQLGRYIDQLRSLEGTWLFTSLQVDGHTIPAAGYATSCLLIDGDRFRSETPEGIYEGLFNIDVESQPHGIDIDFIEGPEAGNRNNGIFELEGGCLKICLDLNGNPRPSTFVTTPGSGHALETLRRASADRPSGVTGGTLPGKSDEVDPIVDLDRFKYVESQTLTRLQGDWSAEELIQDGKSFPAIILKTGRRTACGNEIKVSFGGRIMIHALVRIDATYEPIQVDYCNLTGPTKGTTQEGLMRWDGDDACFVMAPYGQARPIDFSCAFGSGHTYSRWRLSK